jgi:hypothetical protein
VPSACLEFAAIKVSSRTPFLLWRSGGWPILLPAAGRGHGSGCAGEACRAIDATRNDKPMIAADPHLDGECLDDDFGGLAASEEEGAT